MENNKQINIFDVAQYVIKNHLKGDYSQMKIQKLVFLVYSKYLVDKNKHLIDVNKNVINTNKPFIRLFENDFESWQYGPVSRSLYFETSRFGYIYLKKRHVNKDFDDSIFNEEQKNIMNYVNKKYGPCTASKLVKLTHEEGSPWSRYMKYADWSLNKIKDKRILLFYSKEENKI